MNDPDVGLKLISERVGNKWKATVRFNGDPVFMDTLNPANANHRNKFVKAVCAKLPEADPEVLDGELMKLAETASTSDQTAGSLPELDIACVFRPEQFHHAEVSGLCVPVAVIEDGAPATKWKLYLRWADGRRDALELPDYLDAPGGRLWVHPIPPTPSINMRSGWSASARSTWLTGSAAPDPAELFKELCQRIAFFIDLPSEVAPGTTATLALWVMLSYCYQAWDAVPYLFVGGLLGSGKSRVFEILTRLTFRALTTSNLTAPALFRTLHNWGGTLLFDEAERLKQSTPDQQEVLSMFLAGYKRGGTATRLEPVGDKGFRTVTFDVYGPKALACIAGLPPTLASRCIQVTMFRASPDSPKPTRRIDADPEGWQRLRDDLHALALEYGPAWLDLARRTDVCPVGVHSRDHELWQPLLALAAWVEEKGATGLLKLLQKHAQEAVETGKDEQVSEADEVLLEILTEEIRSKRKPPTPGELLAKAKERDLNTFDRWIPKTVSKRLSNYGIPAPKKSHGERRYAKVTMAELLKIQRHYGIDLDIEEKMRPHPDSSTPNATCVPGDDLTDAAVF